MNSRGISGFRVVIIIILLVVLGYVGYQVGRIQFTYGLIKKKVEEAAKIGPLQSDAEITRKLMKEFAEAKVQINLDYDTIYIDRSIPDSFRIYVAYNDSSNIFGLYTYRRHLIVDVTEEIKIQ